jgi:hypothetical protein
MHYRPILEDLQPRGQCHKVFLLKATCAARARNFVFSLVRNNTIHFDNYRQTTSPTEEGDNKSSRDTTVSPTETQTPSQRTPAKNERKRNRDSQDNQDANDDERSSKRRRTLFSPLMKEDDNTKFACPYRKHNPRKYCVRDWRPCALTPLDTVARVKYILVFDSNSR